MYPLDNNKIILKIIKAIFGNFRLRRSTLTTFAKQMKEFKESLMIFLVSIDNLTISFIILVLLLLFRQSFTLIKLQQTSTKVGM